MCDKKTIKILELEKEVLELKLKLEKEKNRGSNITNAPFGTVRTTGTMDLTGCMFDGLEPGVYGISCPCPKCSPTY